MTRLEVSLDATREAVDWVRTLLGGTSYIREVHIAAYAGTETAEQPGWAFTLSWYLPADRQAEWRLSELSRLLSSLARTGLATELRVAEVASDAAPATLFSAGGHRIGRRFVLLPPEGPAGRLAKDDLPIRLGSSLAFGSGLHPATVLCLELLEEYVQPHMRAVDLGCGSGILSIAMARLGASVLALDNDHLAVEATQQAVRQNGVEQHVAVQAASLGRGNQLGHWMGEADPTPHRVRSVKADGRYQRVVANLLARIHVTLARDYHAALAGQGLLIASGFTGDQEQIVALALMEAGFARVDSRRSQEWVALVLSKG